MIWYFAVVGIRVHAFTTERKARGSKSPEKRGGQNQQTLRPGMVCGYQSHPPPPPPVRHHLTPHRFESSWKPKPKKEEPKIFFYHTRARLPLCMLLRFPSFSRSLFLAFPALSISIQIYLSASPSFSLSISLPPPSLWFSPCIFVVLFLVDFLQRKHSSHDVVVAHVYSA